MKTIILVAYDLNPRIGSESGVASIWLKIISKYYFVELFTREAHKEAIESESWSNITFHYIKPTTNKWVRRLLYKIGAHNISSAIFIKSVKKEIMRLPKDNYYLLHSLSPFGIYTYNDLYRLGIPVLSGPILGNLSTPSGFKRIICDGILSYFNVREVAYKYIMKTKEWKNYFQNSKKIIAGNELAKSFLPRTVIDRCVVIYDLVVDVDFYKPAIKPKKNKDKITILFAGRLLKWKGIISLIEACRICVNKGFTSFEIVIAGTGPLINTVEKLIAKYSLQTFFKFVGRLDNNGILKQYQNSDIFCLPTLRESGGIAIIEAMACGLPVITSNYGGPTYSTTDETAIRINLSNYANYIRDLANALMYLMNNEDVRIKMGEMGRERVKHNFSLQSLEKQIQKLYMELVD